MDTGKARADGDGASRDRIARAKLSNIQCLRFFAAFIVLIYHADGYYAHFGGGIPHGILPYVGFCGVDIFFVISGLIIWKTTTGKAGPSSAIQFAYRRITRIFVSYLPIAGLWSIFLWCTTPDVLRSKDWFATFTLFPQLPEFVVMPQAWTLTYELYFYLAFATAILINNRIYVIIFMSGYITVFMLQQRITHAPLALPLWFLFFASPLVFEFFLGCLIGWWSERQQPTNGWQWIGAGTIGLLALGTYGMKFSYIPVNDNFIRALTFGVCAACIVHGTLGLEGRLHPPRALIFLGEASYGIYLLHLFVLSLVATAIVQQTEFWKTSPELAFLALLASVIGASSLYLAFFERPALKFFHVWLVSKARTAKWRLRPNQDEDAGDMAVQSANLTRRKTQAPSPRLALPVFKA